MAIIQRLQRFQPQSTPQNPRKWNATVQLQLQTRHCCFLSAHALRLLAMASVAQIAHFLRWARPNFPLQNGFPGNFDCRSKGNVFLSIYGHGLGRRSFSSPTYLCSAANKPSSSSNISSTAKIRSEVLSPFRSVRMFFYLAFIASGSLGGLIAISQLIGALANPARTAEILDMLKGLGIDIGAVTTFAFLYSRENKAKNAQLARLAREESLSDLKVRIDEKKTIPVSSLRGIARLVILAGPGSFIEESFKHSEPFTEKLLERGVLVVPFATDGEFPNLDFDESQDMTESTNKRRRLWQLVPFNVSEWSKWIDEQKKLANVSSQSPVYMSLRMDGRVRGSGVGYPPWNAFVAQLPPLKGMWSGVLDGMDGRVL